MDVICALVRRFLPALARKDNPALLRRPVVIGRSSETRGSVVACSDEAARTGVVPGMLITRALVLCPTAAVVPLREEQVQAHERAFAAVVGDLCPALEQIEPGHVHADVRGMAKLTGLPPATYLAELQEAIAGRTGLPVRIGGASTIFAAHAAAGYLAKPWFLVDDASSSELLAPLPVDALPLSARMLERLKLFGIAQLGQLGELPPAALQAQFGREGLIAWRLVHGESTNRITPGREEVEVVERLTLPSPAVLSTPLLLGTEILLQRALHRPEIDGRALRRTEWVAELENEERLPKRFVFQEPTSDRTRMFFLMRAGIERLELPSPAIGIELTLSGICSEYARQERLWQSGPRGQAALGEAAEQLTTRTGSPQIYRIVEVEPWSRIPERQRALQAYSP